MPTSSPPAGTWERDAEVTFLREMVARSVDDPTRTACLASTADEWVTIRAPEPGRYTLQGALSVRGVLAELSPTCTS